MVPALLRFYASSITAYVASAKLQHEMLQLQDQNVAKAQAVPSAVMWLEWCPYPYMGIVAVDKMLLDCHKWRIWFCHPLFWYVNKNIYMNCCLTVHAWSALSGFVTVFPSRCLSYFCLFKQVYTWLYIFIWLASRPCVKCEACVLSELSVEQRMYFASMGGSLS